MRINTRFSSSRSPLNIIYKWEQKSIIQNQPTLVTHSYQLLSATLPSVCPAQLFDHRRCRIPCKGKLTPKPHAQDRIYISSCQRNSPNAHTRARNPVWLCQIIHKERHWNTLWIFPKAHIRLLYVTLLSDIWNIAVEAKYAKKDWHMTLYTTSIQTGGW